MNYDKLKKVLVALGVVESDKVSCAVTAVLTDGTTIGADAFEIGNPLFIVAADGTQTPAPAGTYTTADTTLTVDENGLISEAAPIVAEEEAKALVNAEVDAPKEEAPKEEAPKEDKPAEGDALTKIVSALEALLAELNSMKTSMSALENKVTENAAKVDKFSKAPGAEKIKTGTTNLFAFRNAEMTSLEKKMAIVKEMRAGK